MKKAKFTKATVIPALCALAMACPQKANANWAAGIGYLFSGLLTGGGTAVVANACKSEPVVEQPTYYVQEQQPQQVYVPQQQPQPVYVPQQQPEYYVPAQQPVYEQAPVVYTEEQKPVRRIIRRRIIRRTVTTQQGYSQPVVEEVIEEIPVNQQYIPQYQGVNR